MSLNSIFQFFVPKDKKFFPLFEQATANLTNMSIVMIELVNSKTVEERNALIRKIEDLEHVGDDVTHAILTELSRNFITPFDREDIHDLASKIDDVADYLNGSAKDFLLYDIMDYSQSIKDLINLIHEGAQQLQIAVRELQNLKNVKLIHEAIVKIHSVENKADNVLDQALADLFKHEEDVKELIKMKEVLSMLELATDKCEDAANVISSIVLKNS
ncbi:DUF47 domain-containing protein [Solitalea canadensis]|uniref:Phosphate transport regulator related to PhoU n=1 Tax=Solitalea canadensis (strain ATCC 29591 / DSM 3403 / JCM 21819 / LMG 8368 / NBRC 15130 / NCIMB 12057 / USAM 9D) TaxID=929556 RepID=H8KRZ2_SOLCM|nr:DUF47 family protein [Solitalea canadensis]AFD07780.1 phosphate transport regulator related to PhoU [Solitalea canadensis DSM 3403]